MAQKISRQVIFFIQVVGTGTPLTKTQSVEKFQSFIIFYQHQEIWSFRGTFNALYHDQDQDSMKEGKTNKTNKETSPDNTRFSLPVMSMTLTFGPITEGAFLRCFPPDSISSWAVL